MDLSQLVFCHGQPSVALSRVTDVSKMTVLFPEQSEGKTTSTMDSEGLESVQPVGGQAEDEFGREAEVFIGVG